MILKLHKNDKLRIKKHDNTSTTEIENEVSDNFKERVTGIMITECPNINAKTIVDKVKTFQSGSGKTKRLTNIRFQLPYDSSSKTYKYNGTYDELYGYTKFGTINVSGFDDSGNFQSKPAIVGDWYMSDYVDSTMLQTLTGDGTGNGLYRTTEPAVKANYIIDWSKIAVQSVDSTKPNYNPAVAVILNSHNLGTVHENTNHFKGKWWITKDEVKKIKDIGKWFASVSSIKDNDGIVTSSKSTYDFTSFDALAEFTSIKSVEASAFAGSTKLKTLKLPPNISKIPESLFDGCAAITSVGSIPDNVTSIKSSAFKGCANLAFGTTDTVGKNVIEIEEDAFNGCAKLNVKSLPSDLRYISNSAFKGCSKLNITEVPSSVSFIGQDAFNGCSTITSLHIDGGNSYVTALSGAFDGANYQIYVGNTKSSVLDEKKIESLSNNQFSGKYSDRYSNWFTKNYASKIPTTYEIQSFAKSDGLKAISEAGIKFTKDIKLEIDTSFLYIPDKTKTYTHGSTKYGLTYKPNVGVVAKIPEAANDMVLISDNELLYSSINNFTLDLANQEIKKNGKMIYISAIPTVGDSNETLKLFGDAVDTFGGTIWLVRVSKNDIVTNEIVPVKRKSDNMVGLYDIKTAKFYATSTKFTSESHYLTPLATVGSKFITENGDTIVF